MLGPSRKLAMADEAGATERAPIQQQPQAKPQPLHAAPVESANLVSRLTFHFAWKLLQLGSERTLESTDLPPLPAHDHAAGVTAAVEREWAAELAKQQQKAQSKPSLQSALYRAFAWEFWAASFHAVLEAATCVIQPVLLRFLLEWLVFGELGLGDDEKDGSAAVACTSSGAGNSCPADTATGAMLVLGFVVTSLVQAVTHHQLYMYTMRGGWNLRMACTGMVHSKLLKMGGAELLAVSSGNAVNLISSDVMKFDDYLPNMHYIWAGPLEVMAVVALVWIQVGAVTTLAGTAVTLVVVLCQLKFSRVLLTARQRTAKATDARVRSITEILNGITAVKAYNWESPFCELVAALRREEERHILRGQRIKGINLAIFFAAPALTSMITFAVYWAMDNTLDVVCSRLGWAHAAE